MRLHVAMTGDEECSEAEEYPAVANSWQRRCGIYAEGEDN